MRVYTRACEEVCERMYGRACMRIHNTQGRKCMRMRMRMHEHARAHTGAYMQWAAARMHPRACANWRDAYAQELNGMELNGVARARVSMREYVLR